MLTKFLLMRHGEATYEHCKKWDFSGWGADLAVLSERGIKQVQEQVSAIGEFAPTLILSSPMTRALQSAAIITRETQIPFGVEFDIHEWVPDRTFRWKTIEDVERLHEDMEACGGEWPAGESRPWEPVSVMRARGEAVLQRYEGKAERILVVCHGMLIYSLTGKEAVKNAELVEY